MISWLSVLFAEETGVIWENHRPVASHWQTLVVISTDCTDNKQKSPCQMLTTELTKGDIQWGNSKRMTEMNGGINQD